MRPSEICLYCHLRGDLTCCRAVCNRTVTTCFTILGLWRPEFEHPTIHTQDKHSPVQYATSYRYIFLGKIRKLMINFIEVSEFNQCILDIYANHCFPSYPDDNIPIPIFFFITVRSILHAQFETFRGALIYMM